MMFSGKIFKNFEKEHPHKASALKKYIAKGGEWGTIMFLAEYQEYLRFENKKGWA